MTCGRARNVMRHMRADNPPDRAEKWLKKYCPRDDRTACDIRYCAGISPELRLHLQARRGQSDA